MAATAAMKPPLASKPVHHVPQSNAGAKVTVCCKLPNGLVLQLHKPEEVLIPLLHGGAKAVKEYHPDGAPITAHGWRTPNVQVFGQYALTPNVPKEFWERWLQENKDSAVVTNKLIFAHERADHAQGVAKEQRELRSGLEPLNMNRINKVVNGSSRSIAVDPRVAREAPRIKTDDKKDDSED